mmetsp:Transcript_110983/g.166193  ORF Transcript_110983/g.166193 Transcript_110983/m.166193 type:complete len:157 (-) Transcript_110983:2543-3013(-)
MKAERYASFHLRGAGLIGTRCQVFALCGGSPVVGTGPDHDSADTALNVPRLIGCHDLGVLAHSFGAVAVRSQTVVVSLAGGFAFGSLDDVATAASAFAGFGRDGPCSGHVLEPTDLVTALLVDGLAAAYAADAVGGLAPFAGHPCNPSSTDGLPKA